MGKACPSITRLACCHLEVSANKTLVDWTDEEHVVYPAAKPAPKDDTANEPADEAVNDPDDANDKCKQCKRCRTTMQTTIQQTMTTRVSMMMMNQTKTPRPRRKKTNLESESDDESKSPKDQSAVLRDSWLGHFQCQSQHRHGCQHVSTLVVHPRVKHDTGLPLPTRLPSMGALEELANDLYAYSGKLFRGLGGDQYGDVRQDPVWIQEVGQTHPQLYP